MAMMFTGLLIASIGLCVTAVGALMLGGEIPDRVAMMLGSGQTPHVRRARTDEHPHSGTLVIISGMVAQFLGAALATAVWTPLGATIAVALAWGCVGVGALNVRHAISA